MDVEHGSALLANKKKINHNIVKGISLGFVPCRHQNILWYNCDTGHIGPANHAYFDKDMNNLPLNFIPPNQSDLEESEQSEKFPAEPIEVDTQNELLFFVYAFTKMEQKILKVLPTCVHVVIWSQNRT